MIDRKLTGRGRRMAHFRALQGKGGLNVVSLMDIFTIMVFFLLVNSSAQQLPNSRDVQLPTSVATAVPQETLAIVITRDAIVVGGREVSSVAAVLGSEESTIAPLVAELRRQARLSMYGEAGAEAARAVTIMGDRNLPYGVLSRVLNSCREADYRHIAFAAVQQARGG